MSHTFKVYLKKALKDGIIQQDRSEYGDSLIKKDEWYIVYKALGYYDEPCYYAYFGDIEEWMKEQYQYEPWAPIALDFFSENDDNNENSLFFMEANVSIIFDLLVDQIDDFIKESLSEVREYMKIK